MFGRQASYSAGLLSLLTQCWECTTAMQIAGKLLTYEAFACSLVARRPALVVICNFAIASVSRVHLPATFTAPPPAVVLIRRDSCFFFFALGTGKSN